MTTAPSACPFVGFTPSSQFVAASTNGAVWSDLEPLYEGLRTRLIDSAAALETLILDRSELDATFAEAQANLYIATTRSTTDAAAQSAYLAFMESIDPKVKRVGSQLDQRIVNSPFVTLLPARYSTYLRALRREIELFRDSNIPLQTEAAKTTQRCSQIMGAMSVQFDGREQTLQQMAKYQESTDRTMREAAWKCTATRRLRDRDAIDTIYDELIALRHQMSINAGFTNYRDYQHAAMHRFDYSPSDCIAFHDAVATTCVPLKRELESRRAKRLDVSPLCPWDLKVDLLGRGALAPFENARELVERSIRLFHKMDPELGEILESLDDGECLDLESRMGKAPGGYQYQRQRTRRPFIFMNAAGQQRDLVTLVHEAGHAFHSQLSRQEPLLAYRESPIEFAEVASMSMELLSLPYLEEFYTEVDSARHRRVLLEGIVELLPWVATIDAFQHWIYTNPTHSRAERTRYWLELDRRFGSAVDWSALPDARASLWQRQGHLFSSPFYYIEYGIAQLGALQVWATSRTDERGAIESYKSALALGGSRPLPELFAAAGVKFDFSANTIGRLMNVVRAELDVLPE